MCGRYKRRSDKQRIAEAFHVGAGLDETIFEPGDDFAPQSLQPVIYWNEDGERQIETMRWAFKLENRPKLLFNARSEGIKRAPFWKDAFLKGRCIVPADAIYEWQESGKGREKTEV
jgi:putative SOS response-associated peptidase YedK